MTKIPAERQSHVPGIANAEVPDHAIILDVRNDDEWARGHAPGAVHIPLPEVEARLHELPAGRPVVVTCRGGGRAGRVVAFLNAEGIPAVNLEGGMMQWLAQGRPLICDGDATPTVT